MRPVITGLSLLALGACGTEPLDPSDPFAPEPGESVVDAEQLDDVLAPPPQVLHELWATCGDPVCSGWVNKGLPKCGNRQAGDTCPESAAGRECDPGDFCNTTLVCDSVDPTLNGCPISKAEHKHHLVYVEEVARKALATDLLQMKLATYRYRADGDSGPAHLGFIIDDVGESPAVLPSGERVNLYGYTSMAVATIQEQQTQIAALEARLAALEGRLGAP